MNRFIFFDLETGGLLKDRHPITQLAAVAVDETYKELAAFEQKIHVNTAECSPEALKINHYDEEVWRREAIPAYDAAQRFAAFVREHATFSLVSARTKEPYPVARLFGHNAASFDGPFLFEWYKRLKTIFLPADPRVLCTMQLAGWYFTHHPQEDPPKNLKLGGLCDYFGINLDGAHDALKDVRGTVQLAKVLHERAAGKAAA